MHCATSLDMQQSECQNSFEHTFFSSCSRISCLNKGTRNPIFCSFLHYETAPEEGDANARNADIDDSRQSARQRLGHHGSWEDWSLSRCESGERQKNTRETNSVLWTLYTLEYPVYPHVFGVWEKNSENSTSKEPTPKSETKSRTFLLWSQTYTQTLIHTAQVFLLTHDVTALSMQRHSLIRLQQREKCSQEN